MSNIESLETKELVEYIFNDPTNCPEGPLQAIKAVKARLNEKARECYKFEVDHIVKQVLDILESEYNEENLDVTSLYNILNITTSIDDITLRKHPILIRFPEIIIRNKEGSQWTIKELYLKFHLEFIQNQHSISLIPSKIQIRRGMLSKQELKLGYLHSHADPSNGSYCVGPELGIAKDRATGYFNPDNFYNFLFTLETALGWESLDGGPHREIDEILSYKSSDLTFDNNDTLKVNHIINKIHETCRDKNILPPVTVSIRNKALEIKPDPREIMEFGHKLSEEFSKLDYEESRNLLFIYRDGHYFHQEGEDEYISDQELERKSFMFKGKKIIPKIYKFKNEEDETKLYVPDSILWKYAKEFCKYAKLLQYAETSASERDD